MIRQEDLFAATNGGLDILLFLFPQAANCVGNGRKFKLREDEKTASATITQNKEDGNWLVTDFGSDSKPRNAINWYAAIERITWVEALNELARRFNVIGAQETSPIKPKAIFEKRPAESSEKEGEWSWTVRDILEDFEIEAIVSKNVLTFLGWFDPKRKQTEAYPRIKSTFEKYNFYSLESYSKVKDLNVNTFKSHQEYPIFIINEKGKLANGKEYNFQKIYQPLHEDKSRRFMYTGGDTKPKTFVHGLAQAQSEFKKREAEILAEAQDDFDDDDDEPKKKKKTAEKLPEFILCSGGSDAINVALLGYWVGWMNSETAELEEWQFKAMQKCSKEVYQLQDIDTTGKASAHNNAMKYLDLRTIELPDQLLKKRDKNYNFCKDVRDYFNHWTFWDFKELVKQALPYRFWEMEIQYAGRGDNKYPIGYKPIFDNVQAYNFLSKNGFYRMNFDGKKNDYVYVQIVGNIVREVKPNKVKNFVHAFLEDRQAEKDLRNMVYKTTQLNESSLSNLPEITLDFTDYGPNSQLFFFENCTVEVTKDAVKAYKPGVIKKYVWEEKVMPHVYKQAEIEPFKIWKTQTGEYDIEIINKDCMFLKYLVQTSRVHWQVELEDKLRELPTDQQEKYKKDNHVNIAGPLLSPAQQLEQKHHLINKIFALGYLLHQYKDQSKSWAVIAMDNKMNDDGGSHGGSGKTIFLSKATQAIFKKTFTLPGTNPKITENPHIYGTLTKHHQYIYIDDMDKYMKFRFFFDLITSEVVCNPKQADPYTLAFEDIAKVGISTNFTLLDQSPSVVRRVLYVAFSDYYHDKGENSEYQEEVTPSTDLGLTLFVDFNKEQWNSFYSTMMYACKFFMNTNEKISPPMGNVRLRNLEGVMGIPFKAWADVYFAPEIGNTDKLIIKEEAFEEFSSKNKLNWSTQKFSSAIKAFCSYYGYQLNPSELINTKEGRIIHSVRTEKYVKGMGMVKEHKAKAKEFIYIRSSADAPINAEIPYKDKEEVINTKMDF